MKKIFMFLVLAMLCFASFTISVRAYTVIKVYTKHENRYTNITDTYGDYTIRDYFYYETEEWVVDGTVRTFEGSCPNGWAYVSNPGGGVTPFSIEESNGNGNKSKDIEIEYRAFINMGDVLLLDQCLAEPAVDKRLSNCHEDRQHGNQTKLFRKE